jgi:hypothetical protein
MRYETYKNGRDNVRPIVLTNQQVPEVYLYTKVQQYRVWGIGGRVVVASSEIQRV